MEDDLNLQMQLKHYYTKLQEINDDVITLSGDLRSAKMLAEENWQGLSGEACKKHLDACCNDINIVRTSVSDTILLLRKMEKGDL